MDNSSTMLNAKHLKFGLGRNSGKRKSRICNLPDSVLKRILSFLDIKEAVKTSVLSKRWEFLWTSLPKLKFEERNDEKMEEFMDFMGRALLLRDFSNIGTFSLTCCLSSTSPVTCITSSSTRPATRIKSWICAAVKHKVQKIILDLGFYCPQGSFTLSRHLFACESLNKLKLDFFFDLRIPYVVHLPNLKILTLSSVSFMDDNSIKQLFSGCPKLETLYLRNCNWGNVSAVYISAPMLVYLTIYESRVDERPGCQFMISGPRLSNFHYTGVFINEYSVSMKSAFVDAHVDISGDHPIQRRVAYNAYKLLRALANVNDLCVSSHTLDVLSAAEELLPCLPLFHGLHYLEVKWRKSLKSACKALLKILHNSPHLESIYFGLGSLYMLSAREGRQLDPVPSCFLTHLKRIHFERFLGDEEDVNAFKTIVKSARALEEIYVYPKNESEHNAIRDRLEECMKPNVVLHIES